MPVATERRRCFVKTLIRGLTSPRCRTFFFFATQAGGLSALFALAQSLFLTRDFLFREHSLSAALQPAIARRLLVYVAIEEVVVIGELFSGFNVAQGHDPDSVVDLIGFAIWITRMIHKSGHAEAVNDRVAVVHGKEVRYLGIRVHSFASLGGEPRARIFQDVSALFDGSGGVNAGAMQGGRFDDYGHLIICEMINETKMLWALAR
jgi:hypothetical protein